MVFPINIPIIELLRFYYECKYYLCKTCEVMLRACTYYGNLKIDRKHIYNMPSPTMYSNVYKRYNHRTNVTVIKFSIHLSHLSLVQTCVNNGSSHDETPRVSLVSRGELNVNLVVSAPLVPSSLLSCTTIRHVWALIYFFKF